MNNKTPDDVDIRVGHSIRAHRLAAGLSQSELAESLGVTFQQVQKYEKGVNRVGAGRLTRIARVLKVPVATFFESGTETHARHEPSTVVPLHLIADRSAWKLLAAYAEIRNRDIRHGILTLVEGIAATQAPAAQKAAQKAKRG